MSPSTESSEARATWIQLVETLLEQLKTVFDFEHTLTSELEFREEFWKLPDEFNSPNVDRNWGIFLRLHGQIMYMVQTLDKSIALESPQSLSDVFWTYALAALQVSSTTLTCLISPLLTIQVGDETRLRICRSLGYLLEIEFERRYPCHKLGCAPVSQKHRCAEASAKDHQDLLRLLLDIR